MLTLHGGNLSTILQLSCLSNKSSYVSWITWSVEQVRNKCYSSSTRFSLHTLYIFVVGQWCHEATSTPNLCDQVWGSVKALWEPRLMGGWKMWLDSWHFGLVKGGQHWRLMFVVQYSKFDIFASCNFIHIASSNLSPNCNCFPFVLYYIGQCASFCCNVQI